MKMQRRYFILTLVLLFVIVFARAESYTVNNTRSSVVFRIKCLMIGNVSGKFKKFTGNFEMDGKKLKSFNARCRTSSISTGNSKRDKDLKSEHFFHVLKFPEMKLKMVERKQGKVLIKLTIKGITKNVFFDYKVSKKILILKKDHRSAFSLTGIIDIEDFNLDLHGAVGGRSLVLGHTVRIVADVEGF
jgi:polyisoprenoid-binding protein YceI